VHLILRQIGISFFFFSSRRRHTRSVSAFLLNRSSDLCSRLLEASTMKSRRGFAIQRLMNAMRQAHADGWFIVFDTLTFADDRLEAFYDNPNALRDYFRDRSEERRVGKEWSIRGWVQHSQSKSDWSECDVFSLVS